ncbi:hypothetical protein [uncultured Roseibium sp.]|uniref:hypothetical protein n=1 Tax=uncultured Roseibium sp. TaxID=1936171 RepID=UPI00321640EE
MKRETLGKLTDPEWKAAHSAALADAEAVGADDFEAETYAAVAADIALADAKGTKALREADLEATRQRLAAREAEPEPQATEPDASAGWSKAVAAVNARNGHRAETATEAVDDATQEPSAEAIASGWAKATERVNASR